MAIKHTLLATTFPAAASSGIVARRAVVYDGTNKGDVKLPASTAELTFAGITLENISPANNVAVQIAGTALVESDGSAVMNPGDDVIIVGTTGRVKSKSLAAGSANLYQVIGTVADDAQIPATAGAYVTILIAPYKLSAT